MSRPTGPLRVVVVDDHQMVLDGLRAMLAVYTDQVEIVGEATEPDLALKIITGHEPDITLLDVRLRGSSGLDLCAEIRKRQPRCKVVFLTVYDDEQYLYQALRLGAAGLPAQAGARRGAGGSPAADPSGRGPDRPQPGDEGRDVGGSSARRGVLAGGPPRADPARERGTRADGGRPVQPRHRRAAHRQRGDRQDPRPRDLSQAQRPGPARERSPPRCARACFQ